MTRRVVSFVSIALAVLALGAVLYSATLVDRRPPAISKVSLSAPAVGEPGRGLTFTAIDVAFSEPVKNATVEQRFHIDPPVPGAITWNGTTAIFTPANRLPQDTEFRVTIDPGFEDIAGNVADKGLDGWLFRTVGPPVVVSATPAEGTADVPTDTAVVLHFDRLMDTASVEASLVVDPAATVQPTWSGADLTLGFPNRLSFGTAYTVTVGTGAADTDGSHLASPFSTHFSTIRAALGTTATIPAPGVAGVSVRTPIALVFDAPIDPASVASALRITPTIAGDVAVVSLATDDATAANPSASPPPGNVLLFTPSADLAAHTTYTVTLDPVVTRAGGGDVAEGRTWSFTTGQPTASGQNQVAFLSARSGVRNVWLMNPDGSNARQLTSELVPVSGFDVSGDGETIAWSAGGIVRVMRIDGTNVETLTGNGRHEYAPRFLPSGKALLVARRSAAGEDEGYWLVPAPGVQDVGERQVLPDGAPDLGSNAIVGDGVGTRASTPAWSTRTAIDPDGTLALVVDGGGAVRLTDLTAPAGQPIVTATGLRSGSAPVWDPASGAFAVVAGPSDGPAGLYRIATDGTATRTADARGSIAIAPNGEAAYLVDDTANVEHVAVAAPSSPPTVLTSGGQDDRWPGFSPDGSSLVFGRVPGATSNASAGIWRIDLATRSLTPLSPDGAEPRWLP